jgi:predicted aconitase with swiveling domain
VIDLRGRTLAPGIARGEALTLEEPLSFWGGFDPQTGEVTDTHHPQRGVHLTGHVVFMRRGRGSSSSSSVLAEAIHLGTAPAAIVLAETDPVVALGAVVAAELYTIEMPVIAVAPDSTIGIADDMAVMVDATSGEAVLEAGPGEAQR